MSGYAYGVSLGLMAGLAFAAPAQAENITVFAAASLKTALDQIAVDWNADADDKVVVSYAGSSALAKQIQQAAPADIFISASVEWMDLLQEQDLIRADSRTDLLGNSLVMIGYQAGNSDAVLDRDFDLSGRLGGGKLAMAFVDSVPAGVYGKQALTSLGLWDKVQDVVAQADNVRAALALVAIGEAPLGIVYATDAIAEPRVGIIGTLPAESHDPIIYPAALTTDSDNSDAISFLDYLHSDAATAVFEGQGFSVIARND
ncbi:molybdate ABC transporter substrate-binding protein [Paracoccus sp. JM45]|nr:molybdate ABC transporter substrate-binding protein [Paracoccus sp. JM45]RJE81728.1 molybdate ABC transporter substrate-binding protein [Paracoccus sp. JM45]